MNVPLKLGVFVLLLGVAFFVALGVGAAVGPVDIGERPPAVGTPATTTTTMPGGAHGHGGR
jgi:hypothetical protein